MKKLLGLLAALSVAVVALALPASATEYIDSSGVTFSYVALSSGGIKITGISVPGESAVDVTIPKTINNRSVTEMDIEDAGSVPADKVKSLQFEDGDQISVIQGNLFQWKFVKKGAVDNNGYLNDGTEFPDTENFHVPDYITNSYNYDSNDDGEEDTYYVGRSLVRVDPEYSGDFAVKNGTVSVLASAFQGCQNIGAVTLPDSIEWIGANAFADSSVTSVNIPEAIMTHNGNINYATFYNCNQLKTVTLEGTERLQNIVYLAFYGCSSLTDFDFTRVSTVHTLSFYGAFDPEANVAIDLTKTSIESGAAAFSHSGVKHVTFGTASQRIPFEAFYKSSLSDIVWDKNTSYSIGPWAFEGCEGITADVLKDSKVTSIDYRSFANISITELTIPESVTFIAGGAFAGNESLEMVNWKTRWSSSSTPLFALLNDINGKADNYRWDSFVSLPQEKSKIKYEYTFPTTLNIDVMPSQSDSFFALQPYLETVNFRNESITAVPTMAFQFCPNLSSVSFAAPEKIATISMDAFKGCLSLKEFPFTKMTGLTSIVNGAFMLTDCKKDQYSQSRLCNQDVYNTLTDEQKSFGLTSIDLSKCPEDLYIQSAAFYNQYNVASVHIRDGSKVVGGAFNGTASATEFICDGNLPASFFSNTMFSGRDTDVGKFTFHDSLETVTIGGQITPQSSFPVFCRMSALKTVSMPNATAIPGLTFLGCGNLENVSMPSVTSIGNDAFRESGLTSVTIQKGVTYGPYAFANCDQLKTVVVEEGVTELSDFMFVNCTNLAEVSLPSTLQTINWAAFKRDNTPQTKIGMIEIPASVTTIEDDAFSKACDNFILRGAPVIEAVRAGYSGDTTPSTLQAIDGTATIYADHTEEAQKVLEAYRTAFQTAGYPAQGYYTIPKTTELPDTVSLTLTGAPARVTAGQALDLSGFTVTYNGQELADTQYTIGYDPADTTAGERTVTVTLTDANLTPAGSLVKSTVSVPTFRGDSAQGTVYAMGAASASPVASFVVKVLPVPPVTEVRLSSESASLYVNGTLSLTATVLPAEAEAAVTWSSSDAAVASVDENGVVTALATGTATITATADGKSASCVVTVSRRSGSSSGGNTSTKTETTTNPDGTVTSTTTNKDGSTTKTETKKDGSSTTEVKDTTGSTGTVKTDRNGSTTAAVTVSDKAVADAKQSGQAVQLPAEVKAGQDSSSAPTLTIDLPQNAGATKVALPVKNVTPGTVAIIVKPDGTEEIVKDALPTKNGLELTIDGDVTLKLVDNAKDFTDTKGHWAEDAIDFASARGLVNGTSSTTFSPNAPTTRAQLWTILARQADADLAGGSNWYEKAQAWAKSSGISDGSDPNGNITRAQMVTMLWRAAGSPDVQGSGHFADVPADSYYAKAVAWAAEKGITTGTGNGQFSPNADCTRAQIVTFLYRTYQAN